MIAADSVRAGSTGAISRIAPAKVNLGLHIRGQRIDGYHLLESLVVFTEIGDRLSVEASDRDEINVSGRFGHRLPADGNNTIFKALDAFRAATGDQRHNFRIALSKELPIAAGIGGGSSDAAAMLAALNTLRDDRLGHRQLAEIALSVGADVPMCLYGSPLVASGIGEQIRPLDRFFSLNLVLVNPGLILSTPDVFAALRNRNNAPLPSASQIHQLEDLLGWMKTTRNDLEKAAIGRLPVVGKIKRILVENGALFARMSGSGATCFGIFESMSLAEAAAARIRRYDPEWYVIATATKGS